MKVCGLEFVEQKIAFGVFDYVCEDPKVRLSQIGPGAWLADRNCWSPPGKGKTPEEAIQDLIIKMGEVSEALSADISTIQSAALSAALRARPVTMDVYGFQFHWVEDDAEYQCSEIPGVGIWVDGAAFGENQWCCCADGIAADSYREASAHAALVKTMRKVLELHARDAALVNAWEARKVRWAP